MTLIPVARCITGRIERRGKFATSPHEAVIRSWHPPAMGHTRRQTRTSGTRIINVMFVLLFIVSAGTTGLASAADDDLDITMTVISDPDTFDISNAKELQLPAALTIKKRSIAAGGEADPMPMGERRLVFDRPELPGLEKGTSAISISAHPDNMDIRQPGFAGESDATLTQPPEAGPTEHESPQIMETQSRGRNTR